MTGWFIAAAIWLVGIHPFYRGHKEGLELEADVSWEELEYWQQAAFWAAIIFWPVIEFIGLFFKEEDPNGN